jgi:nucleoside-diphosphate-sugar epimerase
MSLERKRILLAGGTGLAGGGVLRQLLARPGDLRVRVPHRGSSGWFVDDPRVEYMRADLTHPGDCERAAAAIDYAVLAAAQTGGARQAREQP